MVLTERFEPPPLDAVLEWREPESPLARYERPEGSWSLIHLWLPEGYNRQSWYPITEGDTVRFRLRFMVGQEIELDGSEAVITWVMVEGRAVEFVVGGVRDRRVRTELTDGLGETGTIELPPEVFRRGLNQVDIISHYLVEDRISPRVAGTFTVANGSIDPLPFDESMALAHEPSTPGDRTSVYRLAEVDGELHEVPIIYANPNHEIEEEHLSVVVRLRPTTPWARSCEGGEDRIVLVAFQDGELVPLGREPDLRATVNRDSGSDPVFRFEQEVPRPPDSHSYSILMLAGFGHPARQAHGGVAPWQSPNLHRLLYLDMTPR